MITINDVEIKTVLDGMTWSGAKDMCCRTLTFSFLHCPFDKNIPVYKAKVGDKVVWSENDNILFQGYIETMPYNTDDDTIQVTCQDFMSRLMRSKAVGRFRGTLNELCNSICGAFNLKNGVNVDNTHVHNIVSNGDLSYFEVLDTACKTMFERYCLYLEGITLKLAEHNSQATFEMGKSIRSSNFSQSISDMVTRVIMIDNDGKIKGVVENKEDLETFGLFQEVYNYNKDSKNNLAEASKLLKSVTNEGGIVVDNNNACISGRFITIHEPINNFEGLFEIQTDNHTIGADGSMELEVKYVASR